MSIQRRDQRGYSLSSNNSLSDTDRQINNYRKRLSAVDVEPPKQDKNSGLSLAGKATLGFLNNFNRPVDAYLNSMRYLGQGKNPLEGAAKGWKQEERYSGADIMRDLGVKNKTAQMVGGLATEIAADPLNLVTLGVGSLAKGVVRGGATLSKEALQTAAAAKRVEALNTARLELQRANNVSSTKGLASKLGKSAGDVDALIAKRAYGPAGQQAFDNAAMQAARDAASRKAGRGATFMGKTIASGEAMQNLGGVVNKGLRKSERVDAGLDKLNKSFDTTFAKALDVGERGVLKGIRTQGAGAQSLQDVVSADIFRNIAKMQRGVQFGGKDIDKVIGDIIATGGAGMSPADWNKVITTTPSQQRAWADLQKQMKVAKPTVNATVNDLKNTYTSMLKGIGMREVSAGVLPNLVDQFVPAATKAGQDFATYFPRVISRNIDRQVRKGSITRNFNVKNTFAMQRKEDYTGKSVSEINKIIREKAAKNGQQLPENFEFLETSALNALMSRQLTSNKVLADKQIVNNVLGTFGKKISGQADISKALYEGYDIVVPVANVNLYHIGRLPKNIGDDVTQLQKATAGESKGVMKLLERNGDVLAKIDGQDAANFVGNVDMQMYALPKGIAQQFNKQARIQLEDGSLNMAKIVNGFYSKWKPLVTGLRFGYHTRNLASSSFNNFLDLGMDMLDPATQKAAMAVSAAGAGTARNIKIKIKGKTYTSDEIHKLMVENNALNTFFLSDSNTLAQGAAEDISRRAAKGIGNRLAAVPAAGRAVGNRTEEYVRAVNFIAHLKQGMPASEAAEMSRKFHFDYQDLTDFEKTLKLAFPFYTWARKNIPLQIEHILNDPRPYLAIDRASRLGAEEYGVNREDIPDYARESMAIPYGMSRDGRVKMFDAGLPVSDLSFGSDDVWSMLNPMLKVPLEVKTGQNLQTGASLYSYGQDAAIRLSQGDNLVGRGIQAIPFGLGEKGLEMAPEWATKTAERAIGSAGVLNEINKYYFPTGNEGGALPTGRDANTNAGLTGFPQRMVNPNMVRYLDTAKAKENKDRDHLRELGNIVQLLNDKGIEVPTINDIKKSLY